MDTLFNIKPYNIFPEWDEYEVYHDESKDNHVIHAFLFIPTRIKPIILSQIGKIRAKYNNDSKLHYNDLTGTTENIKHKTAKDILILMEDALRSKRHNKHLWGIIPPCCKFVLFFKRNTSTMSSLYYGSADKTEIYTRKVETLLRIGLKSGLHFLFGDDHKVKLTGFYTDGIGWSRPLDKKRIIGRLHPDKEAFIDFDHSMDIIPILSNHKSPDCSDQNRAHLLQITDLLLGAFKACVFQCDKGSFKYNIATPIRQILLKQNKRKGFFRNSGHHKSFSLTKSSICKNGKWEYEQFSLHDEGTPLSKHMVALPFSS
ncbi:MAG: hypothetical protein WC772_01345 [Candidatus Margulisiibacteriota bacterium]|jgi:hypothetical protein